MEVENIVLYVADAVRFDAAAERLSDIGRTHKSIAASLHTPTSFASILTGTHPPTHQISWFGQPVPDERRSIFDIEAPKATLSNKEGELNNSIRLMFPASVPSSLESQIENPPFLHVVRGPGGHAPFDGFNIDTFEFSDENANEYLIKNAGNAAKMESDYERAVDQSVSNFQSVVNRVHSDVDSEKTLLIYTSDHGELLGEHGMISHGHVACPELVYVPTTLVHPSLEPGMDETVLRHVDILPTILDALGRTPWPVLEGTPRSELDNSTIGYNHFSKQFTSTLLSGHLDVNFVKTVESIWSGDGGHVFNESGAFSDLMAFLGLLLKSPKGHHMRQSDSRTTALRKYVERGATYGNPGMSREEAKEIMTEIKMTGRQAVADSEELSDHLRALGYHD